MKKTPGVILFDKNVDGGYITLTDIQGENDIYVSRLRQDASVVSASGVLPITCVRVWPKTLLKS